MATADRGDDVSERVDRIRTCLRDFVMAYANVESLDHDAVEVRIFEVWLRAAGALGLAPSPPITRVGTPTPKETP